MMQDVDNREGFTWMHIFSHTLMFQMILNSKFPIKPWKFLIKMIKV